MMENTHAIPVIDTNRRRGIADGNLTCNKRDGIVMREREKSR